MQKSFIAATLAATSLAGDCSYFQNLGCQSGDVTTNPSDWVDRSFQTPLPGTPNWKESYQGMGRIVCFNNIIYNSDRTSAEVEAKCRQHSSIGKVEYNWADSGFQSSSKHSLDSSFDKALTLVVKATDNDGNEFTVQPESPNFIWQNPTIN